MSTLHKKLTLSAQAFWDFDRDKLDPKKNAEYTITKVLERGNSRDFNQIMDFYGKQRVTATVMRASTLTPRALKQAKTLLNLNEHVHDENPAHEISY